MRRQFDNFGAGGFELVHQRGVLPLRLFKCRSVVEAKLAPGGEASWFVPSCASRRAHEHALEFPNHGVSVKSHAGLGRCGQGASLRFEIRGTWMILKRIRRDLEMLPENGSSAIASAGSPSTCSTNGFRRRAAFVRRFADRRRKPLVLQVEGEPAEA